MDLSPLMRRPTISRQSGPTHLQSYALKGITVSYVPPIPIPDPVKLPTNWTMPSLPNIINTIDLSKEKQVLEQAKIRRQAIAGEATSPQTSLKIKKLSQSGIPLIPYQASSILTPVPVSTVPTTTNTENPNTSSTDLNQPLGEMSLRDFEGDSNDPFEATALQAIDDISELQSVLQPATNTLNIPAPSRVSQLPPTTSQPLYPPVSTTAASEGSSPFDNVLVDTRTSPLMQHKQQAPGTPPIIPRKKISAPSTPPVAPKPKPRTNKPSTAAISDPLPPQIINHSSPNLTQPLPTFVNNKDHSGSHRPFLGVAVLPPIGVVQSSHTQETTATTVNSYQLFSPPANPPARLRYSLPDIRSSLTTVEAESLGSISGMGFPPARVARALKHFEGNDQKVFDFLLLVGEIEEKGYNGDSGETALFAHNQDLEKSLDYLKQVQQYQEVWPEEKIHEAYQKASGDWNKTVDILTQGQ